MTSSKEIFSHPLQSLHFISFPNHLAVDSSYGCLSQLTFPPLGSWRSHVNISPLASSFCNSIPVASLSFHLFLDDLLSVCGFGGLFGSWLMWDCPRLFITTFRCQPYCCAPFFGQGVGDLDKTLPRAVVEENSLLYVIWVYHLDADKGVEALGQDKTAGKGDESQQQSERSHCSDHTQTWHLTADDKNVKLFAIYCAYTYACSTGIQLNIRNHIRLFGVKCN